MTSKVPWLAYLSDHIGLKEIKGPNDNPIIVEWGKLAGIAWWYNDDDAWCAVAVNGALVNAGYPSTKSALARSFMNYGTRLDRPIQGAIVVFPRGKDPLYGHVGIVESVNDNGTITVVNGNVGDEVRRSVYRTASILPGGIRWPPGAPLPGAGGTLPGDAPTSSSVLRVGSRGDAVADLQRGLNVLNYGLDVDGYYGAKTKNAVIEFQSRRNLVVDGMAGSATLAALDVAVSSRRETLKAKETAEGVAKESAAGAVVGGATLAGGVTAVSQVATSFSSWEPTALVILLAAVIIAAGAWFGYKYIVRRATSSVQNRDEEPERV